MLADDRPGGLVVLVAAAGGVRPPGFRHHDEVDVAGCYFREKKKIIKKTLIKPPLPQFDYGAGDSAFFCSVFAIRDETATGTRTDVCALSNDLPTIVRFPIIKCP